MAIKPSPPIVPSPAIKIIVSGKVIVKSSDVNVTIERKD